MRRTVESGSVFPSWNRRRHLRPLTRDSFQETLLDDPSQPQRSANATQVLYGYIAVSAVAFAMYFTLPGMGSAWASLFIASLPIAAVLVGVRLHRPSDVRPWYLLAVGQAMVPIANGSRD